MLSSTRGVWRASRVLSRQLHASRRVEATSEMLMPAMSPTMTEGTLNEWKVQVGDKFSAGDVLLSLETDKASIDVEAQDDGVMGKILIESGTQGVKVGELIAILAEEGDDLASIEVPSQTSSSAGKEDSSKAPSSSSSSKNSPKSSPESSASKPQAEPAPPTSSTAYQPPESVQHDHHHPTHSKPLLPSVLRALILNNIKDASQIKATGFKGTLTKGDVLAYAGKISSAHGSLKDIDSHALPGGEKQLAKQPGNQPKAAPELIDGPSLRQLIAAGLGVQLKPKPVVREIPVPISRTSGFDEILDQYLPPFQRSTASRATATNSAPIHPVTSSTRPKDSFDALLEM